MGLGATPVERQDIGWRPWGSSSTRIVKIHYIKQVLVVRVGKTKVQAVLGYAGGGSIDFIAVELVRSWPTTLLETTPVFSLLFSPLFALPTPPPEPPLPVEKARP